MNMDSPDQRLTAEELLENAKRHGIRHEGQTVSQERVDRFVERAAGDHQTEAVAFGEVILDWLIRGWNAKTFTTEQRIFSLALASINLRRNFPAERGGPELFDRIAQEAWQYFRENAPNDRPVAPANGVHHPVRLTEDELLSAARFCEEIIAWLNDRWNELAFTAEQRIFSAALATINLRQHVPIEEGGTELFDRVAGHASSYFAEHA